MEDLSNLLKNYFSYLEKLVLLWEGVPKRVSKPINAIEILSEQLKAVSRLVHNIDGSLLIFLCYFIKEPCKLSYKVK